MKIWFKYFWFLVFSFLIGCKEVSKDKHSPIENSSKENSITLITFSMNDSLGFNTAGWGVEGYYYIDLDKDSVFTHNVDSYYELIYSIQNKSGFVKEISHNKDLVSGIQYLESKQPGIICESIHDDSLHWVHKSFKLVKEGKANYYFLDYSYLQNYQKEEVLTVKRLTDFLTGLKGREELKISNFKFDEAKVMLPVSKATGFDKVVGAPIVSEIKITHPVRLNK